MGHCAKQHMGHPLSGRATQITVLHAKKAFLFKLVSWSHLTSHISHLVNSHPTGEGTAAKCAHICHSKIVVRQRKRAWQYGKES